MEGERLKVKGIRLTAHGVRYKGGKVEMIDIRLIDDVYEVKPSDAMAKKLISLNGKTISFSGTLTVENDHKYLSPTEVESKPIGTESRK